MAEYDVVENLLEGEPTGGVTIPDASTTAKGIAQFNPDDFTVEAETAKVSALQKVGIPQYIGSVINITGNEIAVQLSTNSTKPRKYAEYKVSSKEAGSIFIKENEWNWFLNKNIFDE